MSIIFSNIQEIKAFEKAETEKRGKKCTLSRYGDDVLDVTEFVNQHPGGPDLITEFAGGEDMKEAFDDHGHSSDALAQLHTFKIGSLKPASAAGAKSTSASLSDAPAAPKNDKQKSNTILIVGVAAIGVVAAFLLKKKFF
jgi:cytochrome b involved in lipid metabolism